MFNYSAVLTLFTLMYNEVKKVRVDADFEN